MPVLDTGTRTDGTDMAKAQEIADAEAERNYTEPAGFVTGNALASDDQELERNRELMKPRALEVDPHKAFRAPRASPVNTQGADIEATPPTEVRRREAKKEMPQHPGDMIDLYVPPQEQPRVAERPPQPDEPAPPAEPPPAKPAQPSAKADTESDRLEREIFGDPAEMAPADALPDVEVDVAGRKYSLSRIREGEEALRNKMEWERANTQRAQAMATAWEKVMADTRNGLTQDPIRALRQLGMSDAEIRQKLSQSGFAGAATNDDAPAASVTKLPDDADPMARALFNENRRKDRELAELRSEVGGIKQSMEQERAQRSAQANEAARLALLSGVKSDLKATALKMQSMREQDGSLSKVGSLLVDAACIRLENELRHSSQIPDVGAVRQRAFTLFGQQAREHGVTPKLQAARNAIERPTKPVPARAGTTNVGVHPGASGVARPGQRAGFDWSDDTQRRNAMRAEMDRIVAELNE